MKNSKILPVETLNKLGVLDWGYTEELESRTFDYFSNWVTKSHHSPLNYLSDHRKDLRKDLRAVFPECKSALVFLFGYKETKKWMLENNKHEVAAYTLGFEGEDYHHALKRKLMTLQEEVSKSYPGTKTFISLDAQPVMERDLAFRAGLGWFGKNSMLINRKEGSYFIIGSLLLNQTLDIESSSIDSDHCGKCMACIDACPTDAIDPVNRTLKADKCISTFTIEIFKDSSPPPGFEMARGEMFGCDICQDVCPWNKKTLLNVLPSLKLSEKFSFLSELFFKNSKEKIFETFFKESNRGIRKKFYGTPFDRPGKEGWLKNLKAYFHPK